MYLETLSNGVGGLSHILAAALLACDCVDEVVRLTRKILGNDVSPFGCVASYSSIMVAQFAISAVGSIAYLWVGGIVRDTSS